MDKCQEREDARHDDGEIGCHHGIDHQIAKCLTPDDTIDTAIAGVDRHKVAVAIALTGSTCCQSDAEDERLLQDEHQNGWDDEVAVAAGRVENRHVLEIERTRGNQILTHSIVARQLCLYLSAHGLSDSHGCLVDSLIGEHQRHVAIDTHHPLLHTVQMSGEIGRY